MKLLFVAPLLDMSGFANASRRFLRSLIQCPEMDVTARALKYDQLDAGQSFVPEPWLTHALEIDLQGVEVCIQMTTCNVEAQPIPGILNGLYTFLESDRMQPAWAAKANEFDFLMVASKANAEAMQRSGVIKPILVCAVPCDKDVYEKKYEPFQIAQAGNRTIFYNICQLSYKKGIDALLRAYYAAFADRPDEVLLILKTYINMQDRSKDADIVKQYIQSIRERCRIPVEKYPPVLPLVYTMTDDGINGLHVRGDAYVCPSRAEGWNLPLFDALCHGKTIISNAYGGMADYIKNDNSLVYGGMSTLFFDSPHPDAGLFTGVEQCFEPCIPEMALLMRKFHLLKLSAEGAEWESILIRRENAAMLKDKFDYRQISKVITEQLFAIYNKWRTVGEVKFG